MTYPKLSTIVMASSLIISLATNVLLIYKNSTNTLHTVSKVKDGDTVIIDNNQTVRLVGIEAPELDFCGGQESRTYLENLIEGQKVTLTTFGVDKYARTLALLTYYDLNINKAMLSSGWAVYESFTGASRDDLAQESKQAMSENKGLFSLCRSNKPDQPNCTIKGNINRDSKLYLLPSCSNYEQTMVYKDRGESWFCTEAEAQKAGFKKSESCR